MSIEREGSDYFIYCDVCPTTDGPYCDFEEAVAAKKASSDWKSTCNKGLWIDQCKECNRTRITKSKGKIEINLGGV